MKNKTRARLRAAHLAQSKCAQTLKSHIKKRNSLSTSFQPKYLISSGFWLKKEKEKKREVGQFGISLVGSVLWVSRDWDYSR